jgi:hypothetical protein
MTLLDTYRDALIVGPDVKELPKPEPLIEGMLDRNSTTFLFGPSGCGKTFVALDWAMHVATNTWWNGAYVEPGKVLYVVAEGVTGFGQRVEAWEKHHPCIAPAALMCLPMATNLFRPGPGGETAMEQLAAELEPELIVFDTLSKCWVGAEENSARDMGIVLDRLERVRRASGATILGLHHTGKDETRGLRGSIDKSKNHAGEGRADLRMIVSAESMVLVPSDRVDDSDELTKADTQALEVLTEIAVDGGVAASVWLKSCEQPDRTHYRARGRLLKAGLVHNVGTEKQPRYAVTATAKPLPSTANGSTATTATPLWSGSVAAGSERDRTRVAAAEAYE